MLKSFWDLCSNLRKFLIKLASSQLTAILEIWWSCAISAVQRSRLRYWTKRSKSWGLVSDGWSYHICLDIFQATWSGCAWWLRWPMMASKMLVR